MLEYTKIIVASNHTKEIARKFFSSIDSEISAKIIDIIDGKNPDIQLEMKRLKLH